MTVVIERKFHSNAKFCYNPIQANKTVAGDDIDERTEHLEKLSLDRVNIEFLNSQLKK